MASAFPGKDAFGLRAFDACRDAAFFIREQHDLRGMQRDFARLAHQGRHP